MANEKEVSIMSRDVESGDPLAPARTGDTPVPDAPEKKPGKEDPDAEDPRLYSPLQEPDSPPARERVSEKPHSPEEHPPSPD